jgi:hypothetical protein
VFIWCHTPFPLGMQLYPRSSSTEAELV